MMATIIDVINLAAAALIVLIGLFSAINNMSRETRHTMRVAWLMMTTGALGVLLWSPPWASTLLHAGMALHIVFDVRSVERYKIRRLFTNMSFGQEKRR